MASEQTNITKATAHAGVVAARVAVQAMATANADNSQRLQNVVPKICGSIIKQLMFNWVADDKYSELKIFF